MPGADSRPAGDRTGHRCGYWALSRANVLDVGEGGRPAFLLEDAEGAADPDRPAAHPAKVGGDGEDTVQVNGDRRGRHGHASSLSRNQFLLGLASDTRRPCLSQGGLSRGDCGTPFRPTRLSSRTAESWPGAGLGPFRPLPLPPLWAARVSPRAAGYGRPLRRADLAHSRVRGRRR